jgi:hypothetical protein
VNSATRRVPLGSIGTRHFIFHYPIPIKSIDKPS